MRFEGGFCVRLSRTARKALILKRRDVGVVDRARLESVSLSVYLGERRITPRAAKAADNVGCEPPQIPSIKAQSRQTLAAPDLCGHDLNPQRLHIP